MDEKSTWSPTWRTMDKVSWSPIFRYAHLQELGWRKFQETMTYCRANSITNSNIDFKIDKQHQVFLSSWDILYWTKSSPLSPPTKYAMVPQHGPFSLHTMLEGPWLHIMAFPTPMVWPLDESQGSSPLQGHGSWLMCEVALSLHMIAKHGIIQHISNFHMLQFKMFLLLWRTIYHPVQIQLQCFLCSSISRICILHMWDLLVESYQTSKSWRPICKYVEKNEYLN